ncbi:hypothetical protein M405DRAFT_807223, partial [Rhizopogon salebrosus TDB-379]
SINRPQSCSDSLTVSYSSRRVVRLSTSVISTMDLLLCSSTSYLYVVFIVCCTARLLTHCIGYLLASVLCVPLAAAASNYVH